MLSSPALAIQSLATPPLVLKSGGLCTFILPSPRLVLEQYGTLDFVSSRTLMQLTHLPPQQLTLLDTWLQEDQAAAAAAAAIPGSSSNAGELTHKPLSTKYSNYWSCRVSVCHARAATSVVGSPSQHRGCPALHTNLHHIKTSTHAWLLAALHEV